MLCVYINTRYPVPPIIPRVVKWIIKQRQSQLERYFTAFKTRLEWKTGVRALCMNIIKKWMCLPRVSMNSAVTWDTTDATYVRYDNAGLRNASETAAKEEENKRDGWKWGIAAVSEKQPWRDWWVRKWKGRSARRKARCENSFSGVSRIKSASERASERTVVPRKTCRSN